MSPDYDAWLTTTPDYYDTTETTIAEDMAEDRMIDAIEAAQEEQDEP